ncbi:MAG: GH25 family lysozyme [Pseudomonadota bacterium]
MIRAWLLCAFAVALLSACARAPTVAPGEVIAPQFGDADPVAFARPRPESFPVHGIDAARFQTEIDWRLARANGVNFAFLKATEGGDLLDPAFTSHWRGAGRAGVARGAYHFYYFCTAPEVQARWFIRNVPRSGGSLPPVLDMEWNPFSPTCRRRPAAAQVQREMRVWLRLVEDHFDQRPIIYTTPGFFKDAELSRLRGYDFWLRSTAKTAREAYPRQTWRFWQYSATGRIDGIAGKVDLNAFNGSRADWQDWLARNTR